MKQISQKQFDELIDALLGLTANDVRQRIDIDEIISLYNEQNSLEWTDRQRRVFRQSIYDTKLFQRFFDEGGPILTHKIYLSDTGLYVKEEYGKYADYRKENELKNKKAKRKKAWVSFKSNFKNTAETWSFVISILAGIATISGLVLGVLEARDLNKRIKALEEKTNAPGTLPKKIGK